MNETREVIICDCRRCHESDHNSNSLSRNQNSRSLQKHSDESTGLAVVGGIAVGFGLALILAACLSKD